MPSPISFYPCQTRHKRTQREGAAQIIGRHLSWISEIHVQAQLEVLGAYPQANNSLYMNHKQPLVNAGRYCVWQISV